MAAISGASSRPSTSRANRLSAASAVRSCPAYRVERAQSAGSSLAACAEAMGAKVWFRYISSSHGNKKTRRIGGCRVSGGDRDPKGPSSPATPSARRGRNVPPPEPCLRRDERARSAVRERCGYFVRKDRGRAHRRRKSQICRSMVKGNLAGASRLRLPYLASAQAAAPSFSTQRSG